MSKPVTLAWFRNAVALAMVMICLPACTITRTARLYDLQTGDVLPAVVDTHGTGHGEIRVTAKDGTILIGEYSIVRHDVFSSGSVNATAESGGQFGWASAHGFTVTSNTAVIGSGVVAANGTAIEVVFEVDRLSGHGDGVGRDNHGHFYRLEF